MIDCQHPWPREYCGKCLKDEIAELRDEVKLLRSQIGIIKALLAVLDEQRTGEPAPIG